MKTHNIYTTFLTRLCGDCHLKMGFLISCSKKVVYVNPITPCACYLHHCLLFYNLSYRILKWKQLQKVKLYSCVICSNVMSITFFSSTCNNDRLFPKKCTVKNHISNTKLQKGSHYYIQTRHKALFSDYNLILRKL